MSFHTGKILPIFCRNRLKTLLFPGVCMKSFPPCASKQDGYTLLELVIVTAIIMFAGAFLFRISHSISGRGQFTTTDNRMRVIEAKIRQYYLAHEQLPAAAGTPANSIPVDANSLDLEQKYRLDGWGNFFQYTTSDTNPGALTGLQDVYNNATPPVAMYAAAFTSNGPDQQAGTSDDITIYIDLTQEANQLAQNKLKVLMEKVSAYDAMFAGVNNNGSRETGDHAIDENPRDTAEMDTCYQPVGPNPDPGCPPISSFCNDPATSLPTLDAIEMAMDGVAGGNAYSCTAGNPLAYHLAVYYHLPTHSTTNPTLLPGGYDIDPWGHPFHWGYLGRAIDGGGSILDSMDFHFHKFFSSGPDLTTVEDDIVYTGK